MAVTDLYKVVLTTAKGTNLLQNRFYYYSQTGASTALDLANSFVQDVCPSIASAISSTGTLVSVQVTNEDNAGDNALLTISINGTRTGEAFADWVGAAFELSPQSGLIRVGRKIFAPISESDGNGEEATAGYQLVVDTLAGVLNSTIAATLGVDYAPALFSPANLTHAFDVIEVLTGVVFKRISSQNSRKTY